MRLIFTVPFICLCAIILLVDAWVGEVGVFRDSLGDREDPSSESMLRNLEHNDRVSELISIRQQKIWSAARLGIADRSFAVFRSKLA